MFDPLFDRLQTYLAGRYPNSVLSNFQFLVSGFESDVYAFALQYPGGDAKFFVLRLYPGDGAIKKMTREALGLRMLHQAGYPVPAMLLYETDGAFLGNPFTILEKLEGRALWSILAGAALPRASDLLDRFGELLARLHQLDWRPFTDQATLYEANPAAVMDEWLASSRKLYMQFNVDGFLPIVDWLEKRRSDIAVQPAVVHLDFHANNVFLCTDNSLVVLDWTQIAVSDYRADLSWTLLIMGNLGQPQWGERILHAYQFEAGKRVENLDYFNVLSYTKLLASTIISLQTNPKELGMRPETVKSAKQQAPTLEMLSQRIKNIIGITIPEVERVLGDLH